MYWVTSFARPVVEKLRLPMILRSFFLSVKQGKRFWLLMIVLLNLLIAPTAIAQEKLQDFDYWASLCSSLVKSRKYKDAVEACNQAITLNTNDLKQDLLIQQLNC